MATPPARTELADTYPNPSNAVFRTGIGKLHDFLIGLLGSTGNAAEARAALGIGAISNRNKVVNGRFLYNPRAVSGTVTLAAGAYGHATWKAGASGCTYTFAASGNDVLITITAGSLIHVIEGSFIESGVYCMSWTGTAQGKIAGGSYAASGVVSSSQTAGTNVQIEFGTGTLTRVQVEAGSVPTPTELRLLPQEIFLCNRYVIGFSEAADFVLGYGIVAAATTAGAITVPLPTPMRAVPAIVTTGSGNIQVLSTTTSVAGTPTSLRLFGNIFQFNVPSASSNTVGHMAGYLVPNTRVLTLTAEL